MLERLRVLCGTVLCCVPCYWLLSVGTLTRLFVNWISWMLMVLLRIHVQRTAHVQIDRDTNRTERARRKIKIFRSIFSVSPTHTHTHKKKKKKKYQRNKNHRQCLRAIQAQHTTHPTFSFLISYFIFILLRVAPDSLTQIRWKKKYIYKRMKWVERVKFHFRLTHSPVDIQRITRTPSAGNRLFIFSEIVYSININSSQRRRRRFRRPVRSSLCCGRSISWHPFYAFTCTYT